MSLTDLVNVTYPNKVTNLTNSINAVDEQILNLNNEKADIESFLTDITQLQKDYLDTKGYTVFDYFGNFGILNLTEFRGYSILTLINLTYQGSLTFSTDDDTTSIFTDNKELAFDCGIDGFKFNNVITSSYITETNTTYISIDPQRDLLSANLISVSEIDYEYEGINWDNDQNIIDNHNAFLNGYNHLNEPISENGTYGIIDRIAKLEIAKNVLLIDKAKYESFITDYSKVL